MEFSQNLRLAHLQLLMNTSAKYQANWTETVGRVVQTRFCRQIDRQTARLIPAYPPKLHLQGYKKWSSRVPMFNWNSPNIIMSSQPQF